MFAKTGTVHKRKSAVSDNNDRRSDVMVDKKKMKRNYEIYVIIGKSLKSANFWVDNTEYT